MNPKRTISLETFFRRQAIRWSAVGFLVTVLFSVPCVLYSAKVASERQLLVMAQSAARAFRPTILQDGDSRDAELKMREALQLKAGESAVVRDPNFAAIYPLEESDKIPHCTKPGHYCWSAGFRAVSFLYPIYFDDQSKDSLFGYLELTLKPTLDFTVLSALVFLLFAAFIGQAFGLSSALNRCAQMLSTHLGRWAKHLRTSPEARPEDTPALPFSELQPMNEAIDGLHIEIEKLRDKAAKDARAKAQLAMLREISHDLKTPHSLLAKYFALHLDTVRTTGKVNPVEVTRFEGTLKRMGELLRQVRTIPGDNSAPADSSCDLVNETKGIIDDLKHDAYISEKQITVDTRYDESTPPAKISRIGFYRILENLVRNAAEATKTPIGCIAVSVQNLEGSPAIVVKDNGCGIASELQAKIFEFDFTTKLARGTGLGLGIVDQLCKDFGAQLRLKSDVGKGAEFTILFKVAEKKAPVATYQEVSHAQV